ncbi:MAG: copper-binding protein [Betaproteobacteria bacterium]|nr:copper-binding protein [Betaproteobacteria bacterium]
MKKQIGIITLLLASMVPLSLAAQPMAGMEAQKKTEQISHQGTGKVVSVDRKKSRVRLAHEPIESLGWSGMTMDFSVAKASLLDGLRAGDTVKFELIHLKPEKIVWVIAKIERR